MFSVSSELTSSSVRCFSNLSSCRAVPLSVTTRAAPPQTTGCVWNCHCSVNTPAFGDLNTNGNLTLSPGRTTPEKYKR